MRLSQSHGESSLGRPKSAGLEGLELDSGLSYQELLAWKMFKLRAEAETVHEERIHEPLAPPSHDGHEARIYIFSIDDTVALLAAMALSHSQEYGTPVECYLNVNEPFHALALQKIQGKPNEALSPTEFPARA